MPSSAERYDAQVNVDAPTSHGMLVRFAGRDKRVLDLGCSTGSVATALVDRGCKVWGVELDAAAAKIAQNVCEHVVVGDLDALDLELAFDGQQFDVVLAGDVLEHLRSPGRVLEQVRSLIRPGGYLVASVPNIAHGSVRLALLHGQFPRAATGLLDDTHLQFLTRDQFLDLLGGAGYTPFHIDATRLAPQDSEVGYPDDALTRQVLDTVEADPDAWVYQHVVMAAPGQPGDLGPVESLCRYLGGELEATRASRAHAEREVDRLHADTERLAATVSDQRLSLEVRALERVDLALHQERELQRLSKRLVHLDMLHREAELATEQAEEALAEALAAAQVEPEVVVPTLPSIKVQVARKLLNRVRTTYYGRRGAA